MEKGQEHLEHQYNVRNSVVKEHCEEPAMLHDITFSSEDEDTSGPNPKENKADEHIQKEKTVSFVSNQEQQQQIGLLKQPSLQPENYQSV